MHELFDQALGFIRMENGQGIKACRIHKNNSMKDWFMDVQSSSLLFFIFSSIFPISKADFPQAVLACAAYSSIFFASNAENQDFSLPSYGYSRSCQSGFPRCSFLKQKQVQLLLRPDCGRSLDLSRICFIFLRGKRSSLNSRICCRRSSEAHHTGGIRFSDPGRF